MMFWRLQKKEGWQSGVLGVRYRPGLLTGCLTGCLPGRGLAALPRESKVAQDWGGHVGGMLTEFVGDTEPGVSRWCGRMQNRHSK